MVYSLFSFFFFLHIKDIVDNIQTSIRLFTDDTSFYPIVDLKVTAMKHNSDWLKYNQWAKQRFATYNSAKAEPIIF